MCVTGTDWCRKCNVEGHHVRIALSEIGLRAMHFHVNIHLKNVPTAEDPALAIHIADLPTQSVPEAKQIKFTFYWPHTGNCEGTDFSTRVGPVSSHRLASMSGRAVHGE